MSVVHLTECERIVMKCVWDAGRDVSLVEIIRVLNEEYHKDWKRQTVSTFLLHLIRKGFLVSYRVGRVFYYHSEIDFTQYRAAAAREFIDFWFSGEADELCRIMDATE